MNPLSWQRPPADVLGQVVPVQRIVARSEHAVIALQHMAAFPDGCTLWLHVVLRRHSLDGSIWENVVASHFGAGPGPTESDDGLKFGLRFPDGSRATTVEHPFRGWAPPTDRPERPMLVEVGSDSSSDDREYHSHQQLWLWPLPPPVPFEFVVEWRILGLDLTSTTLDGSALVRAAQQSVPYWP
jgi:hypothetical protein